MEREKEREREREKTDRDVKRRDDNVSEKESFCRAVVFNFLQVAEPLHHKLLFSRT